MPGNEQGGRHSRPAATSTTDAPSVPRVLVVVALEQLEDGDCAGATVTLLNALEAGPPVGRQRRCPFCPGWSGPPGALEAHLVHHGMGWDDIERELARAA